MEMCHSCREDGICVTCLLGQIAEALDDINTNLEKLANVQTIPPGIIHLRPLSEEQSNVVTGGD